MMKSGVEDTVRTCLGIGPSCSVIALLLSQLLVVVVDVGGEVGDSDCR